MDLTISLLVAFSATLFCLWLLRPIAEHIGLVDRPGGRKRHHSNSPLIGGLAMFFGFTISILTLPISLHHYRGLLAGSALLVLIGVADDFREIDYKARLLSQLVASLLLVIWGHDSIHSLGQLFFHGQIQLNLLAMPLTALIVVTFINAMNMIDGQDGLAGSVALGQTALLIYLSLHTNQLSDFRLLLILATLLMVFLWFNLKFPWRKQANIFMGDAGVTFVAFIIIWFTINLTQQSHSNIQPITACWLLAFPLFDLIAVVIHRIKQKKSPITPGRDHCHHLLQNFGINPHIITLILFSLSVALGIIGILLDHYHISSGWQLVLLIIVLIAYLLVQMSMRQRRHQR